MSEAVAKLLPLLDALTEAERDEVTDYLHKHDAEESAEFDAELDRRRAEHESGADPGVLASDFFRQLREARK